ncbi:hypothetical protein Acr_23g0008600 [Actinidia rufa]|uniref:Uncharacterized protein n=1 Tax=Actinidia rufa TaxID=165716 RepID=A0A7J0GNV4_9ERIC|nr:hypothetical protein Acr_23g0008600 [Actinidia rufa]
MKLATKSQLRSPKESMVPGNSFRNHDLAGPFRVAENALHITSSEQPWSDIRLLYESRWSIGSVFPSYIPSWAGSLNFDEIRALNILSVNGGSVCLISVSTVTGAPTPVWMASSRASKSRIFCEVDLSRALAWSPLRGLLPLLNWVGVLLDSEELFSRKEELGANGAAGSGGLAAIAAAQVHRELSFPQTAPNCCGKKLGEQPTVNVARIPWYWTSEAIKGRPAQTNKNKGPGRGRSKPLRRGDQTKAMTADGVMGRVRGSRRDPRKDEYGKISLGDVGDMIGKIAIWRMEILSTLPCPMARRRQYFGSGRSDEYSEGGYGELNGDDLARFHGLVLPRSRGFGDIIWRSKC